MEALKVVLFVTIPVLVYIIGIMGGRASVKRAAREERRLAKQAHERAIARQKRLADEYMDGLSAQLRHTQTLLTAHTEYAGTLSDTVTTQRELIERFMYDDVSDEERQEMVRNAELMRLQNAAHVARLNTPMILPDNTPEVTTNVTCLCGETSTPPVQDGHSLDARYPCGSPETFTAWPEVVITVDADGDPLPGC